MGNKILGLDSSLWEYIMIKKMQEQNFKGKRIFGQRSSTIGNRGLDMGIREGGRGLPDLRKQDKDSVTIQRQNGILSKSTLGLSYRSMVTSITFTRE